LLLAFSLPAIFVALLIRSGLSFVLFADKLFFICGMIANFWLAEPKKLNFLTAKKLFFFLGGLAEFAELIADERGAAFVFVDLLNFSLPLAFSS
jgi:hypothetical protein